MGPTRPKRCAWARWRAGTPRGRPRARQAAPVPSSGFNSCTAAITASRRCRRSDCPARLQVFLEVDHQQRLVQAQLEVVAFSGELGDVQRLGAVGIGLGATLDVAPKRPDRRLRAGGARCSATTSTRPLGASAHRSRRAWCSGRRRSECGACRRWRTSCAGHGGPLRNRLLGGTRAAPIRAHLQSPCGLLAMHLDRMNSSLHASGPWDAGCSSYLPRYSLISQREVQQVILAQGAVPAPSGAHGHHDH